MRAVAPLVLFALVLTACESTHRGRPTRDGPPFAEAFGTPAALLAADDVLAARERLATVRLPDSKEHHEALVAAVTGADAIDAERLLLLTEAVHGYEFLRGESQTIVIRGDADAEVFVALGEAVRAEGPRGSRPYAKVVDTLLIEGCARLDHAVSPSEAGRLLSRTRSAEALRTVAARVLPDVDDGSAAALRGLLDEVTTDEVKLELALNELLPAGGLEGERATVAVEAMAFDGARGEVVEAVAERRAAIAVEDLVRWMDAMAFDSGRTGVLAAVAEKLPAVGADDLRRAVSMMAFDSGREKAIAHLAPRLGEVSFDEAIATVEAFSFDAGRIAAFESLCAEPAMRVRARDLPRAVGIAAFDAGRAEILSRVAPRLVDGVDVETARELLGAMAFDDGRLDVLRTLKDHLALLPPDERASLCERMSFDSGKERAREILGVSAG